MGICCSHPVTGSPEKQHQLSPKVPPRRSSVGLVGDPLLPSTLQVLIALSYKGVEVDFTALAEEPQVDKLAPYNLDQALAKSVVITDKGAKGKDAAVPKVLSSKAALEWVERTFPTPPLHAIGPSAAAKMEDVLEILQTSIVSSLEALLGDPSVPTGKKHLTSLEAGLTKLESMLAEHVGVEFVGGIFSMIDVLLASWSPVLAELEYLWGWQLLPGRWPRMAAYFAALEKQASCVWLQKVDRAKLRARLAGRLRQRLPPPLVSFIALQHQSILHHLARAAALAAQVHTEELTAWENSKSTTPTSAPLTPGVATPLERVSPRGEGLGSSAVRLGFGGELLRRSLDNPFVPAEVQVKPGPGGSAEASPRPGGLAEVRSVYSKAAEIMLEHTQMEERVVFPLLQSANKGAIEVALAEHQQSFPAINGIKSDISTPLGLPVGSKSRREALEAVIKRLEDMQASTAAHFAEEEAQLLPILEKLQAPPVKPHSEGPGSRVSKELVASLEFMERTHGGLFAFFISGLKHHEQEYYLRAIVQGFSAGQHASYLQGLVQKIKDCDKELFSGLWEGLQARVPDVLS